MPVAFDSGAFDPGAFDTGVLATAGRIYRYGKALASTIEAIGAKATNLFFQHDDAAQQPSGGTASSSRASGAVGETDPSGGKSSDQ